MRAGRTVWLAVHDGTIGDPLAKGTDFPWREGAFLRHAHGVAVGKAGADELDKKAVFGATGEDRWTVFAALQEQCPGAHAEAATAIHAGVTAEAVVVENGLHLVEVDVEPGVCRGCRSRLSVGGDGCGLAAGEEGGDNE